MGEKLGTVDVPDELKTGLKHFTRLEGQRSADKLVEDAGLAYLKVIRNVIGKDSDIQARVAKKRSPSESESVASEPVAAVPEGEVSEVQTGPVRNGKKLTAIAS